MKKINYIILISLLVTVGCNKDNEPLTFTDNLIAITSIDYSNYFH